MYVYDATKVEFAVRAVREDGLSRRGAARALGCSEHAVREWLRRDDAALRELALGRMYSEGLSGKGRALEDSERAAFEAAMEENMLLRAVLADLKAGGSLPGSISNRRKTELSERLRAETGLPLREITAFLRISKSSYEYHRARLGRVGARELVGDEVERIFREEGDCARGYRFVHAVLAARLGRPVSEKIVRDVMRERGLRVVYAKRPRRYSSYAGELDEAPANIPLDEATGLHDFRADAPNEKWVTDITEFRLPDAPKVYLSPVVDLYDGKPVSWSIGLHPTSELANSSLEAACGTLREGDAPFCHSDRGVHYRTASWKLICAENGVTRSMSRKGRSPDNAACEGFFGRLKNEFFYGRDWSGVTAEAFIAKLDAWLRFYSEGRLKAFSVDGKTVYDTIDHRREVLGLAA